VLLESRPDFAEVWFHKGRVLLQASRLDEAIPCFAKALELSPRFESARVLLERARAQVAV